MNNEILKKISNDKLNVETNEELFDLIKQILSNYAFKYNDILLDFLKDRNLLKIFKLNRKQYGYRKESYLSNLSLTYILIYLDNLLKTLDETHVNKKISTIFLKEYFDDENKLISFVNSVVGDVFDNEAELSTYIIKEKNKKFLTDNFLIGIHKTKLYYNIYFGKICNRYIINYKKEVKNNDILLKFIYKVTKNLNTTEIIFIYNLNNKEIEKLTSAEQEILTDIVNAFSKNNIVVKNNLLVEEDVILIKQIPKFLANNEKIIFNNFQECNRILKKEEREFLTFDCYIKEKLYFCKIRKTSGSLHFCLYDDTKLILKDRIYYLDDLNRFIILIDEYNQIIEKEYNFWSNKN